MSSLLEIKEQIKGVQNTKKITKAMELVAASKSKQFQEKAINIRQYGGKIVQLYTAVSDGLEDGRVAESKAEKTLFILYSSDKGLCGPLNMRLYKALIGSKAWKDVPSKQRKLITLGRKAKNIAGFEGIPVEASFEDLDEKMTLRSAITYIDSIMKYWKSGDYKYVYMVAPKFINAFSFETEVQQTLPLTSESLEMLANMYDVKDDTAQDEIYEPSRLELRKKLYDQLTEIIFLQFFYELKASEYSSRMIAMSNASENASNIIKDKKLELNKMRQANITQQIAEIVGGNLAQ